MPPKLSCEQRQTGEAVEQRKMNLATVVFCSETCDSAANVAVWQRGKFQVFCTLILFHGTFVAKLEFSLINLNKDTKYFVSFGPWSEKNLQFSLLRQINNAGHFLLNRK